MGNWADDMDKDQLEHPENWPESEQARAAAGLPASIAARHVTIPDEPPPIPNDKVAIQDLVIQDIAERKQVGIERYGTPLQTGNGRDMLVDLYQELLDATMYVRGEIEERNELLEHSDFEAFWRVAIDRQDSVADRVAIKTAAYEFAGRVLRLWLQQHPTVEKKTASKWFDSVIEAWQAHWAGKDHRYGRDFFSFVGERFVTDFDLRDQERVRWEANRD